MNSKYKVTIAMPIYNVADYVGKSFQSALNQTFESIEFLLVDDKGSDNSMGIIREIISEHPRGNNVQIVAHEKNMGLAVARNTAIENANGEYIYFLDSDDTITPNCIDVFYKRMMEHPVDFIAGSHHNVVNSEDNIVESTICPDMLIEGRYQVAQEYFYKRAHKKWLFSICNWNKLYKLSFLKEKNIRCIPGYLHEDHTFTFDLVMNANSCSIISEVTYFYYQRLGSIMNPADKRNVPDKVVNSLFHLLSYQKERVNTYSNEIVFDNLLTTVMYEIWMYMSILYDKTLETKLDKKRVKALLRYPTSYSRLKKIKNKKLANTVFYFIGNMPFFIQGPALRLRHRILKRPKVFTKKK